MEDTLASIVARSVAVSASAVALATSWSLPLAYRMAVGGRLSRLAPAFEALTGIPTVLVGLALYALLSREGPLGFLGLLYTPLAIALGEAVLVTPLYVASAHRVLRAAWAEYGELALALGASHSQAMATVLRQAAPGVAASAVMAFSRAIGELGVALVVGGNIAGRTRTMTTAIALYTAMGEYGAAMRLGAVLLAVSLAGGAAVHALRRLWEP